MPGEPDRMRLSPRATTALGAICVGLGLLIVLLAAGVIPSDESRFPFATASAPGAREATGRTTWRSFLLGGAIVGLMAVILNWIAFGPGQRGFSGGLALPFVSVSGPASEWTGRVAFAIGAVLVDVFLVWMTARGLRDLVGRRR